MSSIIVTKEPKSNVAVFSCRKAMPPYSAHFASDQKELPKEEIELREIQKLPGVCRIYIASNVYGSDHDLQVTKHMAYTWDEIEPEVVSWLECRERGSRALNLAATGGVEVQS